MENQYFYYTSNRNRKNNTAINYNINRIQNNYIDNTYKERQIFAAPKSAPLGSPAAAYGLATAAGRQVVAEKAACDPNQQQIMVREREGRREMARQPEEGWDLELFLLLLLLGVAIPASGGCPLDCVCYPSPMTVSCQSHHFLAVPEGIPEDSERIFLQNNQISLLLQGHFSPSIVTLWVYSNNITFVDPETFRDFTRLEELDLGDNRRLRELAAETFHGLVRLHALHLYRCGLSSLPDGIFRGLHSLQYLYLQDNHLAYLQEGLFLDLVNLSHLFLHGNKLRSLQQDTFRGLVSLDRLLLHQNRLQSVHRLAFRELRQLTLLFLFNNSLTQLPGDCLAPLAALEYLRLNGNPWSCTCLAQPLWEWLRRFRGSSSSVLCDQPEPLRGQDLKELQADSFRGCSPSESLHQTHGAHPPPADRAPPRDHPPLLSSEGKGSGPRKTPKNCTRSRHRSVRPASVGKGEPDFKEQPPLGLLPRPKGKCLRTPRLPPSGVQQAAGSRSGGGRAGQALPAVLLAWMLVLVAMAR